MSDLKPHTRENDILLGPIERPALQWFAAHMPPWVMPDTLTGIGIFGAILVLIGYLLSNTNPTFLWLAIAGLFINWFGDSLDGTLARYRHIERPKYGFFLDHTVDAFNTVIIIMGVAVSTIISFEAGTLVLVGYLLMSIMVYVQTYVEGKFKIAYGKFGPTEMRALLVLLSLYVLFFGVPYLDLSFGTVNVLDILAGFVGVALIVIYIVSVIQGARGLADADK